MATKVGQPFTFLFTHMIVIGLPDPTDGSAPSVGANRSSIGVSHTIADVIVITDGIEGFPLGVVDAPLQQLRIEDLLLDGRVDIELVGKRTPNPLERIGFTALRARK